MKTGSVKEFETFFEENYRDHDMFGRMYIPVRKRGGGQRVKSICVSGSGLRNTDLTGEDHYMSYNTLQFMPDEDGRKHVRRDKEHVRRLMFCYVDLDTYNIAPKGCSLEHFNEGLIQELEENDFNRSIPCPSYVISSGRGLYMLWKVDEHVKAYPRWVKVQRYLYERLKAYGADNSVVTDSARVFRILGSQNSKSGRRVELMRDYGKKYTLYEIMSEYGLLEEEQTRIRMPRKYYIGFEDSQKLFLGRMSDLKCLLKNYRDKEDGFRENILFLYRYYHLCLYRDKEGALRATKKLNDSLQHPLPEKEVIYATRSAEKYFDAGCSFGISDGRLLRFLDVQGDELSAMQSIRSPGRIREEKKKKNRAAYKKRLKEAGKQEKRRTVFDRREKLRRLLEKGCSETKIREVLRISRTTFYEDKRMAKAVSAAIKRPAQDKRIRKDWEEKEMARASEMTPEQLYEMKKKLGLPVKKKLIYMKKLRYMEFIPVPILDFEIVEDFGSWYTVQIHTEDGESVRIHSAYLADMQRPGFAGRLKKQAENQE